MSLDFSGSAAFVTGSARGLGRKLVELLHGEGAGRIYAAVRDPRTAEATDLLDWAKAIGSVEVVPFDVTSQAQADRVSESIDRLDLLVCNAGIALPGGVFRSPIEDMETELAVNYLGAVRTVRSLRGALIRAKGTIVLVASQLVRTAMPALAGYSASKSALVAAGQCMRAELLDAGVKVCIACPSGFESDMSRPFPGAKPDCGCVAEAILAGCGESRGLLPIGDSAVDLFEAHAADPAAAEESKYGLSYDELWPEGLE